MRKFLIAAFAATSLVLSGVSLKAEEKKEDKKEKAKGWNGILIDAACGAKQKDQKSAAEHPKACATKEGCAKSGYGIFKGDKFIKFDAKGNELAAKYLKEEKNGTKVHVDGELSKDEKEIAVKEITAKADKKKDDKKEDKKDEEKKS